MSVHNNKELSDIDKLNCLKSLLECTACQYHAINVLILTFANYHEAVAILNRCLSNKQPMIGKPMDTLLNLDPIT